MVKIGAAAPTIANGIFKSYPLVFQCVTRHMHGVGHVFSKAQILFSHAPTAGTGDAKTEISVNPVY